MPNPKLPRVNGSAPDGAPQNMTPLQLAKSILNTIVYLGDTHAAEIQRTYERTWTLVTLVRDGLATPTKAAHARLLDLYRVVDQRRQSVLAARLRAAQGRY